MNKFVIYPPASYGSKGDEGMLRGVLRLFSPADFSILHLDNESWLPSLIWGDPSIEEVSDDDIFECAKRHYDLIVVGADVIDGSCGVQSSLARLNAIRHFASAGRKVFVFHSYRSGIQKEIKDFLTDLTFSGSKNINFFLRDRDSLSRFTSDYPAANAAFFPDLAFYCDELPVADNFLESLIKLQAKEPSIVALNISEHTFRASCIDHTDTSRRDFVREYVRVLHDLLPEANFLIITNDIRRWENFWSDYDYALVAEEAFNHIGRQAQVRVIEPTLNYGENISILRRCDLIVTGRMHLALAAFRAGCVPVIITGKSYPSDTFVNNIGMLDKASGMFNWLLGSSGFVVTSSTQLGEILKDVVMDFNKSKVQLELRLKELKEETDGLVEIHGFSSEARFASSNKPHDTKETLQK